MCVYIGSSYVVFDINILQWLKGAYGQLQTATGRTTFANKHRALDARAQRKARREKERQDRLREGNRRKVQRK